MAGWAPGLKAFGTVIYNGGGPTDPSKYSIQNSYNISGTVGYNNTYIVYTITFTNPMPDANYVVLLLPSNTDYASSRRTQAGMVLARSTNSFVFAIRALNNTSQYLGEGVTGGYVCFSVFDK